MAVNVKMGVDLSGFNSGIKEGQNILKGLNAEMKATEAEFKATGNSEDMLAKKTKTLNSQLNVQKAIADQAKKALEEMDKAGVKPTDASYQKLYATMMNATAGMNEAQAALNALDGSQQQAAKSAGSLADSVNGIGKKISLDQVLSGINSIKSGLESAAQKAVQLGEAIWNNVMDSARLADDILTQAGMLDMTPEMYQKYKGYFDTLGEITVTEWAAAKRKIEKVMADPNSQIDVLRALGFTQIVGGKESNQEIVNIADNWEDAFWEIGTEIHRRVENGELSNEMADVYGEAIFGKKYSSLKNLIKGGKEAFTEGINTINTASDEALEKDAALYDQVIKLKGSFDALKEEVTSALAPALTEAAKALDGVLGSILEYLKTDDGKEMLAKLGEAVSGLFGDLSKIDPEKVVSGFVEVFTKVTGGIQWLVDNAETAKGILATVVGAWGMITIGENVLKIVKLVDGITGLTGADAAAAGTATGTSWASAFATAAMKAAPFLAFMYTLLDPAAGSDAIGNNTLIDENGKLTYEAEQYGFKLDENGNAYTDRRAQMEKTAQEVWDLYRTGKFGKEELQDASLMLGKEESSALYRKISEIVKSNQNWKSVEDIDVTDWLDTYEPVQVPAEMDMQTTAEDITEAVGTVEINGVLHLVDENGNSVGVAGNWWGGDGTGTRPHYRPKANGLPYVPYDGYLARLHKGERVVPAREIQSRNFSSNLYVENMNMNGGLSADALAASIASRNSRIMAGYGS